MTERKELGGDDGHQHALLEAEDAAGSVESRKEVYCLLISQQSGLVQQEGGSQPTLTEQLSKLVLMSRCWKIPILHQHLLERVTWLEAPTLLRNLHWTPLEVPDMQHISEITTPLKRLQRSSKSLNPWRNADN